MRPLPLLLLCAVFAGCRASPPPQAVAGRFGVVRAATAEDAALAERLVSELVPRLHAFLPDARERPVEVWLQREIELYRGSAYPEHVAGMADHDRGRIHLRDGDQQLEAHLAHELTHLLLGGSWDPLPAALEEGLCDYAATVVAARGGSTLRVWRILEAAGAFGGLDVALEVRQPRTEGEPRRVSTHRLRLRVRNDHGAPLPETIALDDDAVFDRSTRDGGSAIYGVGFLVVARIIERHGIEGLHGMCVEAAQEGLARVPAERIMAAADLDGETEALRLAAASSLDGRDLPEIAALCAETLAEALVDASPSGRGRGQGAESAAELLRATRPALLLARSRARLPLMWSDAFVAAVARRLGSRVRARRLPDRCGIANAHIDSGDATHPLRRRARGRGPAPRQVR